MAKKAKSKKAAPKKTTLVRVSRRRLRLSTPPPDRALLRHEELNVDRTIAGEHNSVPARTSRSSTTPTAQQAQTSTNLRTAKLRLQAISHSRHMVESSAAAEAPAAPVPGTSNWVQLGPTAIPGGQTYSAARVLVSGRVTAIVVDPTNSSLIYAGTAQGGVWKTSDGGATWTPQNDNNVSLAIGALAMDQSNNLVLYAGTGEGNFSGDSYYGNGILTTADGGATPWTELATSTFAGVRFGRLMVTPRTPAQLFAATGNGLFRSINSGVAWYSMSGLPAAAATDVVIDATTPSTVYAAFWSQGIYKSNNASALTPTWTKLAGGLPTSSFTRIALGISASSPQTLYCLMSGPTSANESLAYLVNQFYVTTNGGTSWSGIALPSGNIGGQGFYNLNCAVDPTTPDIVYLSSISLWKAVRSGSTWTISDIGGAFHPDNHAFAFDPANHLVIYAGSDGGIYRSTDGGASWSDSINKGLCIAQFEFIAQHPTSDAIVFGGTQDNGTEEFRNDTVFYHADDGDGGFCLVDFNQPNNVLSTYYGPSPKRSTQAGKFGTWTAASSGITTGGLFYPPLAMDDTSSSDVAMGTDRIYLDGSQGQGGWATQVLLPGLSGVVSAIDYAKSNLIYVGTTSGQVYKLDKVATWTATLISAPPLPGNFIWDVSALPGSLNTVLIVMAGFGISHVWSGAVPAAGTAAWTNNSGTGTGVLPDIPVNALAIDTATTFYIGTDVGVFGTTNGGTTWAPFSDGLPNCAVFDLKLHGPARLLRAGTHGRGLWERKLDVASLPSVNLYVRDHLMDTGRSIPSSYGIAAGFEDPLQYVALGAPQYWWMCADIKVDALEGTVPAYQMPVSAVDFVAFESSLQHRNAQRGRVNRVYVQIHNRGIQPAANVTVKVYFADASAGLPPLPSDFWTAFPPSGTAWTAIGPAKTIGSLSNTIPTIVEWDWSTPASAADHTCLLVVVDSAADSIPAANKVFDVGALVPNEKHAGLKNLHIISPPPAAPYGTAIQFFPGLERLQSIRILPGSMSGGSFGLILPKATNVQPQGITVKMPTVAELAALREKFSKDLSSYDVTRQYTLASLKEAGVLSGVTVPKGGLRALLLITAPKTGAVQFSVIQEETQPGGRVGRTRIVGGSTFVVARRRLG
jgi:photosystem II stability/assembly factor-like uncharacterized protein